MLVHKFYWCRCPCLKGQYLLNGTYRYIFPEKRANSSTETCHHVNCNTVMLAMWLYLISNNYPHSQLSNEPSVGADDQSRVASISRRAL